MHIAVHIRLILFLCFLLIPLTHAHSSDEPFTGPANWGGTGLMEIPTARVMDKDTFRFGVGLADPYFHYYGAISPIRGLEIEGRVTEILGTEITSPGWEGYGNNKTKVMKFTILLLVRSALYYWRKVLLGFVPSRSCST